jgi:SWI/SNF-related matrix-associated actin-dependent regulator 1 of chromatin subfamily A
MEQLLTYRDGEWIWLGGYATKDIAKSAGMRWNPDAKRWWTRILTVAGKLREYADDAALAQIDVQVATAVASVQASQATDADVSIPCNDGLAYLPYQRAGIAYGLNHANVLIGDEMGLGKTIQAIGIINADESIKSVLVICPASLRINWERELTKWLTRKMSIGIANGTVPETDIVIINYDILKKHHAVLTSRAWDCKIIDECHYLKNGKAQRTAMVFGKAPTPKSDRIAPITSRRTVMLTGTPILNRPSEMWTIAHALAPQKFSSWKYYHEHFCNAYQTRYGWDVSGASNLDELQRILRETIMVRRLKQDVLTELPPKRRQIVVVPVGSASKAVAKETKMQASYEAQISSINDRINSAICSGDGYEQAVADLQEAEQVHFTEMTKCRHETALAKVEYAIEHISAAADEAKVVVFAHHHDVVAALMSGLSDYNPVRLTGEDKMSDRQASVDKFQNDPSCKVFIGSIAAAGVGITLTASSHVVFVELDWVPGNISQCEDRTHRIGQRNSVLIQHLVVDGSIDQKLAETIVAKQAVIETALNGGGQDLTDAMQPIQIAVSVEASDDTDQAEIRRSDRISARQARVNALVETITDDQIAQAHADLRRIASADMDHAMSQNGIGFNKLDTKIGHELANLDSLTRRQGAFAMMLANKYRRQLGR